jgi:hypothetical protein
MIAVTTQPGDNSEKLISENLLDHDDPALQRLGIYYSMKSCM